MYMSSPIPGWIWDFLDHLAHHITTILAPEDTMSLFSRACHHIMRTGAWFTVQTFFAAVTVSGVATIPTDRPLILWVLPGRKLGTLTKSLSIVAPTIQACTTTAVSSGPPFPRERKVYLSGSVLASPRSPSSGCSSARWELNPFISFPGSRLK